MPADTQLKRLVDRFLPRTGLPVVVYFATVIGTLNIAPLFSTPTAELALEGTAALAAGGWCALNFWRCRHAHCLVTGVGWLGQRGERARIRSERQRRWGRPKPKAA